MKVTLKDIAEDTGYSVSTVSRALRGDKKISRSSEQKIVRSAQKLNYPYADQTRSLSGSTPHFALITHFDIGEFYSSFVYGFDLAASRKEVNYSLISYSQLDDDETIIDNISRLKGSGYSGAVIFLPHFQREHYQELLDRNPDFPMLSTAIINNPVMDTIAFDSYGGGFSIAEHFEKRGYRNVGILHGPHQRPEALARANGFTDCTKRNSNIKLTWVYDGDYSVESGKRAFQAFHTLTDKPRAIFAANDDMAIAFAHEALAHGYRIPEDIAVAGYDDLRIGSIVHPTITSVHTNFEQLAANIFDKLIYQTNGAYKHQGILNLIPVSLNVKESS